MKSICMLLQNHYEFDIRVRRKAEALVAAGYSVDVLALGSAPRPKSYTVSGVNVRTISLGKKRGSLARYAFEYVTFFLWALVRVTYQTLRKHYVAIDVNTLPDFLVFATVFARWTGAKVILDMHEITPEFYISKYGVAENSWLVRLLKYQEKISFDFADHVITINEPIRELLASRGLPMKKATVMMNSADEAHFASPSRSIAAGPGAPAAGTFVMMYHGTLTRLYGLDIAIEAFSMAHKEMPNAELWILGSGPESGNLKNLAQQHGLASKVHLAGQVSSADIPAWLQRCDAGILPIRRDIFLEFASPNKLAEFIVTGKPVIISSLRAVRHYFSENSLAFVEPNNPGDLAKQMVRVYRDVGLRTRLAANAREEYAPIRWDVMRERYLRIIDSVIDPGRRTPEPSRIPSNTIRQDQPLLGPPPVARPMTANRIFLDDASSAARKLLNYCRANDWAGFDPYDALNSRAFTSVPILNFKLLRLVLTQALKRSPIDIRRFLLIPKKQNPKAIGLFLSSILELLKAGVTTEDVLIELMVERLIALRSQNVPYWSWGYSFPWQTRTILVPAGAANLVCTTFVASALLDTFEQRQDSRCLTMAVSAAEYILNDLYWADGTSDAGFCYPLPSVRSRTHNANFLAAALLCRVYKHTGEEKFLAPALRVTRYSVSKQRADGSWDYGEAPSQHWIDNFHTGYNLCALRSICRYAETTEFESCIRRGFKFYRDHFFREDGAVRYFHDRTYPIDIHCVAQSVITLLALKDIDPDNLALARSVFRWAMHHMWDDRGFFYYRMLRTCTIRTSYMRWSQAWMLLAISNLLCESGDAGKLPQIDDSTSSLEAKAC
jgi:glycosyltransferase involved in cell wall biosynthesis